MGGISPSSTFRRFADDMIYDYQRLAGWCQTKSNASPEYRAPGSPQTAGVCQVKLSEGSSKPKGGVRGNLLERGTGCPWPPAIRNTSAISTAHMRTLAEVCETDTGLLHATAHRVVDLTDAKSRTEATEWWGS